MKNEHIGIVLGLLLGGIIGVIFGGFIGRNFDKAKIDGWDKRRKITVCAELGFFILFGVVPWFNYIILA